MRPEKKISAAKLKKLFSDIINGCNFVHDKNLGDLYFKHLKLYESALIESDAEKYEETAKDKGLPTLKEQIAYIIKEELWSEKKEVLIRDKTVLIDGLRTAKSKLFIKKQRDKIEFELIKENDELNKLLTERDELTGFTVEKYVSKKANEQYIFQILFKDKDFKQLYYTEEEFDEVSNEKVSEIVTAYSKISEIVNDYNIRKLGLSPFFLNIFYLCDDNPYHFYGKPVLELTYYQNELFAQARYFKHLLSESKSKPPDEVLDDPDDFVRWFESGKQAEKLLEKSAGNAKENSAVSLVGASKKDLENLGLNDSEEGGRTVDLAKEAKKKGGKLNMEDLIKLHGA